MSAPWVLGLSSSHNGSACLLHGDEIVVAIQEERINRFKRASLSSAEGSLAVRYCLQHAGIGPRDLAMIAYSSPWKAEGQHPAMDALLNPAALGVPVRFVPHHRAHAFAVFATSGFPDAAVLVLDGHGSPVDDLTEAERRVTRTAPSPEGRSIEGLVEVASLYDASGVTVSPLDKQAALLLVDDGRPMPQWCSLGTMFSSASQVIFGDEEEAGKVMGLAPFGTPEIPASEFFDIVDDTFVFRDVARARHAGVEPWPSRAKEHETLAASVQAAVEQGVLHLVKRLRTLSRSPRLCYAGGVALNSITNERIVREGGFADVYIMPAAEDSGTAIGAAYAGLWELEPRNTMRRLAKDAVGRPYTVGEIDAAIAETPAIVPVPADDVVSKVVDLLCDGKIVGWFEGGSELGPRALGQRSILCDPRRPDMKDHLNARVKHREGFRPFAPIIPLEDAREWFDLPEGVPAESPFMLRICPFRADRRDRVPAVAHVDGTGRLQTVTAENGRLYRLVKAFGERTGVPIVLNTSFNVAGEPIVERPEDALWCLLYTGLDHLVLEDRIVTKEEGYRSILDLYPRRAPLHSAGFECFGGLDQAFARRLDRWAPLGDRIPLPMLPAHEGLRLAGFAPALDGAIAKLRVETPLGIVTQVLDLHTMLLLEAIDGATDGHGLLERAQGMGIDLDPQALVRVLGRLRRASLLGFHRAPAA